MLAAWATYAHMAIYTNHFIKHAIQHLWTSQPIQGKAKKLDTKIR